jgi:hypothetical protein
MTGRCGARIVGEGGLQLVEDRREVGGQQLR